MLWSILICAIPERYHSAQPLLYSLLELQSVMRRPEIELLYLLDNRRRTVGAKRNALLNAARGEYVSFIDDDDEVALNYVQKLSAAIVKERKRPPQFLDCAKCGGHPGLVETCEYCHASGVSEKLSLLTGPADVICFPQRAILKQQGVIHECTYSLVHWRERVPDARRQVAPTDKPNVLAWSGPPAHTMVWKREIAQSAQFPERQFGEDVSWVDQVCEHAKTELQIEGEPLYTYKQDDEGSATR